MCDVKKSKGEELASVLQDASQHFQPRKNWQLCHAHARTVRHRRLLQPPYAIDASTCRPTAPQPPRTAQTDSRMRHALATLALATLALVGLEASAEPWLDAAISKTHKKRDPIAKKYGAWIPETHMWRKRLDYRLAQVRRIQSSQERWDAAMNLAVSGLLVKNFTSIGYEVVKTPRHVHDKLNATLVAGFDRQRTEHKVDQISGEVAGFVDLGRLSNEIMEDLRPMHEEWSSTKLRASNAYGLRIYRPGNTLTMHTDKLETHVISAIVHVDRDAEPWPIVIEGYDGRSVEVDLQPGEMLFYESAKCIHGRPRPLKGKWYTSLFVHYRPVDWALKMEDARALAERWWGSEGFHVPDDGAFDRLQLTGTGYYEPDCEHRWCDLPGVDHGDAERRAAAQGEL